MMNRDVTSAAEMRIARFRCTFSWMVALDRPTRMTAIRSPSLMASRSAFSSGRCLRWHCTHAGVARTAA
jgi:hypothetical protein